MTTETNSVAPHPGAILQHYLNSYGVTRSYLSRATCIPVTRFQKICDAHRGVTAETALALARFFARTPPLAGGHRPAEAMWWLVLQATHELHQTAAKSGWKELRGRIRPLDPPPTPCAG